MNETLFVLAAADELGWGPLDRIQVQKVTYLAEVLAPARNLVLEFLSFFPYRHGPYTYELQDTLDHLVGLGLAEITGYQRSQDGSIRSKQRISSEGRAVQQQLIQLRRNAEKHDWILAVCQLVDLTGLDSLVGLVYQEPTFREAVSLRRRGELPILDSELNLTQKLLREIRELADTEMRYGVVSLDSVLLPYFDYLRLRARAEESGSGG